MSRFSQVSAIARKELRGYFSSAVAVIFLAAFLGVVLYLFFWQEKFFARGIADVRPMFSWLPVLLIFLVSALTMRLWSEEHKVGTIELLMTLPVPTWKLVLGKFLAGFLLIGLALLLTLGMPMTVAAVGDIDWGPVIGGYVATLLLAGAYLSIGLCVSASTDNQIVSLVLTALFCALLYIPGAEAVSGEAGFGIGEILRKLGTGTRFESVARGVVDLRDLAYWLGLIVFFLALNIVLLKMRQWSASQRGSTRRRDAWVSVLLIGLNVLTLNLWLAPIGGVRLDLTEDREFTLSDVTRDLLASLDTPLLIRAYISNETHPKLAPLAVQVRDRLAEYKRLGHGKVRVEFVDPSDSDELRKEAKDQYGIEAQQFKFESKQSQKITNSYFHIVVQYGSEFEVLSWADLIEQLPAHDDILVQLKNFEYDMTRTIKKVVLGFKSVDSMLATMTKKGELIFFVTPNALPPDVQPEIAAIEKGAQAFVARSNGKLTYSKKIVGTTEAEVSQIAKEWKIKPQLLPTPGGMSIAYFDLVLRVGQNGILVDITDTTDTAIEDALEKAFERTAPGFIKTIGIVAPTGMGQTPPGMPGMPPQQGPPQTFRGLQAFLRENYRVSTVDLRSGNVDGEVDIFILAGPEHLDEKALRAVDQFLMHGGSIIVLAGRYRFNANSTGELAVEPVNSGLQKLLTAYGVTVGDKLLADSASATFPLEVVEDVKGTQMRTIKEKPYPYFLQIDRDRIATGHLASAGLAKVLIPWATPLSIVDSAKKRAEVLLRASTHTWETGPDAAKPNFESYPETGFVNPPTTTSESKPVAVALVGPFSSPLAAEARQDKDGAGTGSSKERLLETSPEDARLVVVASSDLVSDLMQALIQRFGMQQGKSSFLFVRNLVDWAVQDIDLLTIRGRGMYRRALEVDPAAASHWLYINYGFSAAALLAVFGIGAMRRRNIKPLPLKGAGS